MTIYQGDTSVVFRLDTGIDDALLATATEISILVEKPSGTNVTWTATQYGSTSEITYTSVSGDLDEAGDYILQAYIEWGTNGHHGDSTTITVYAPLSSRINVSYLIRLMNTYYKNISIQTFTEYNESPQEGTDSEILYEDMELYSDLAMDELANILDSRNITLTNIQTYIAYCHLVADYIEMGEPDWSFRSQSMGSGVSFSRGDKTGPRAALDKLLDQVEAATKATRRSGIRMGEDNLKRCVDHTHYPRRFKMTQIPAFDPSSDGFDSAEMPDLGSDSDRNY
jgi:hypothetical protein